MTASLLHHYGKSPGPPPHVVAEARGWGLEVRDPVREHWETVSDFFGIYCRDTSPAGVLVVASDPSVGGALATGIPFTDAARAERHLNLSVAAPPLAIAAGRSGTALANAAPSDPASERFWCAVAAAKRETGGSLEGLFASVHLATAFPFSLVQGRDVAALPRYLPNMPFYRQACREHLEGLLALLRPQAVACVGRVAFEAVASVAENRLALAATLAERGWDGIVLSREYADGLRAFPSGEFRGFRARLVPVGELDAPDASALASHAHDTLKGLLRDAWT